MLLSTCSFRRGITDVPSKLSTSGADTVSDVLLPTAALTDAQSLVVLDAPPPPFPPATVSPARLLFER